MKPRLFVKQQIELNSKLWGIYVGDRLVKGNFSTRHTAIQASREYAQFVCPP
jgi:hypothetical protein